MSYLSYCDKFWLPWSFKSGLSRHTVLDIPRRFVLVVQKLYK